MSDGIPEIIKRAMLETVVDIGQLSPEEKRTLGRYVRRGVLAKGKGGPFPRLKTVYAVSTFDFAEDRRRHVEYAMMLAELDARALDERRRPRTGENSLTIRS